MTDEELEKMEKAFLRSTQGEYHLILGRKKQVIRMPKLNNDGTPGIKEHTIDPRWDIYVGSVIEPNEIEDLKKMPANAIQFKNRTQIAHFHPETPVIYEHCENHLGDAEFFITAHELVPKMIAEIKRLKEK